MKCSGIEFEDAEAAKEILVRVEKFVVIDFAVFSEDPLVRGLKIGLRRAPFDLVAQSILALVGIGQEGVVQQEHSASHQTSGERQGQDQAIQADATRFEGDDFVVFGHHGESH